MYSVKKERQPLIVSMCNIMRDYYVAVGALDEEELEGEEHTQCAENSSLRMITLITDALSLAFESGYKECYADWVDDKKPKSS